MTNDPYVSAKRIFDDLLEAAPEARARALDGHRMRDERATRIAEAWLRAHAEADEHELHALWQLEPRPSSYALPVPGERIGAYRIERMLSSGGMGVVFLATQDHPHRRVALKFPKMPLLTNAARERFRREAHMLGRLAHPAIARVFAAQASDPPFIAMEYVEGRQLDRYLREHELSLRDRVRLLVRVARGLHHAHQKGIIHRDVKPGNVLVDAEGNPKIIDFGIARAVETDDELTTLTHPGAHPGTPVYMSPEQIRGDRDAVDVRSDVYALGLVAYETLTGTREGAGERGALARRVREARGDLSLILETATQEDPDVRYASADAFASDLARWIRREPVTARPPSAAYVIGNVLRRNKAKVTVVATLVGLVAISSWLFRSRLAFRDEVEGFRRITTLRAENAPRAALRASLERCAASLLVDTTNPPIESPGAYAMIARILLELGDVEAARKLVERGREIPERPAAPDAFMLDLAESAIATHEGLPERAVALFRRVMDRTTTLAHGDPERRFALFHRFATARLIAEGFDAASETIERFQSLAGTPGADAHDAAMLQIARRAYDEGYPRAALDAYLRLERDAMDAGRTQALRELSALAAGMQWRLGRYALAERRYRDLMGDGADASTDAFANQLGVVLRDSGRPVEARRWLQHALEHRRAKGDTVGVGASLNNLAKLAELETRTRQALELYLEAFERGIEARNPVVTDEALIGVARLQLSTGYPEAAKDLLRSQIAWMDRRFGNRPWRMGEIESLLGEAHRQSGDLDTAETLLRSGRDRILAALGPDSALAQSAVERYERLGQTESVASRPHASRTPAPGRQP